MELALSLGDTPKPSSFLDKPQKMVSKDLGFCMGSGKSSAASPTEQEEEEKRRRPSSSSHPPVQLDLLSFSPIPRNQTPPQLAFSWLTQRLTVAAEPGSSNGPRARVEMNRRSSGGGVVIEKATGEEATALSSPNSTASSFQMDFPVYRNGRSNGNKRDLEANTEAENDRGASSRASDEDENGLARKKLRLRKEQSAFLEESFKEHNTLNPKQKLALAKQLNLRPRQVEVWFQNRRARTKLKQTEVDCEHLKRCCETLTEENRRLQKELQELRALKSSQPFYLQLPATTLTMCPSCERVVTTTATASATTVGNGNPTPAACTALTLAKPIPFSPFKVHATKAAS